MVLINGINGDKGLPGLFGGQNLMGWILKDKWLPFALF